MSKMSAIDIDVQEALVGAGECSEEEQKAIAQQLLREAALSSSKALPKAVPQSVRESYYKAAREYMKSAEFGRDWDAAFHGEKND